MDLTDAIRDVLPVSSETESSTPDYRCERCGATYEYLATPCEQCGNSVLSELSD